MTTMEVAVALNGSLIFSQLTFHRNHMLVLAWSGLVWFDDNRVCCIVPVLYC